MPKIYRECTQCESDFYIKESDQQFFEEKELELPKRCWPCRQKNKREAAAAKAAQAANERSERMNGQRKPGRTMRRPETDTAADRKRIGKD
jgi:hypothetical protein